MNSHKKINVSHYLHRRIEQEAKRLKLSQKDYLEIAASFFLDRQLDPRVYHPETTKQIIQQVGDRIVSHMVHQERNILNNLLTEAAKARILGELSVNHLLTIISNDDISFQQLQQQDQHYLAERLQKVIGQSDTK